nr:MAG TPA: hypothetical protein [Caudoviricetes sp.]
MVIISYRKFMFNGAGGAIFVTKGGGIMEEAPDWIPGTMLYKLAYADGSIVEVKGKGGDKEAETAEAEAAKRAEETAAEAASDEGSAEPTASEKATKRGKKANTED